MMDKGKDRLFVVIPDNAFPVREIGNWTIYVSKTEQSVYIASSPSTSPLRLAIKDLEELLKVMGRHTGGEKAAGEDIVVTNNEIDREETSRNKRQFRRFTRRCEAEFTAGDVTSRGIASDFSLNGLFLKTNYPVTADTLIEITVHLPGGATAKLKGKVKRSMKTAIGKVMGMPVKSLKNGMGVQLIERDAAYLHFIRSLL
ncbi:MAG: PilZ domain-containing protein [Nitrospiraceae bacterium]|nr:PilZ domain-containing protein [Nitrospiraceae bacterium]